MELFDPTQRKLAAAISSLVYVNPFLPERIEAEKEVLGEEFRTRGAEWNIHAGSERHAPNLERVLSHAESLVLATRELLAGSDVGTPSPEDARLYEDLVLFHLYHGYRERIFEAITSTSTREGRKIPFYGEYVQDFERFLSLPSLAPVAGLRPPHTFAVFFNLRRAFHHIFTNIIGTSPAASRLRAEAWQSIFTHDLRRYTNIMHGRMADITCLVTGPSGTGKELVARAIGLSRYLPFDEKTSAFTHDFAGGFYPLNLSALSSTLIESELFGHRRGSFTGAEEDHAGWFEVCGPFGTVFLDEIGDTEKAIQVKLLRVLQNRSFQRLGDTRTLRFEGKIIAATNRDLAQEMRAGRFREDLYYRICSDIIVTHPLREHLAGSEAELSHLVEYIARREVGDEGPALAREVLAAIEKHLGRDYPWPGNFRELEQCVRNVLVRSEYRPAVVPAREDGSALWEGVLEGNITVEELTRRYCTLVYARTGKFEETSRRLGIDRRTIKARIDPVLFEQLRAAFGSGVPPAPPPAPASTHEPSVHDGA